LRPPAHQAQPPSVQTSRNWEVLGAGVRLVRRQPMCRSYWRCASRLRSRVREGSERRERRASAVDHLGRLRQAASLCLSTLEHEELVLDQEGEQRGR